MNSARHAREQLMSWPGLTGGRASCGSEYCVRTGAQEIVHFHSAQEAEVHLSRTMVAKLLPALSESTALRVHHGSGWVTVRLDCRTDIDLLITLVSAALQAGPAVAEEELSGLAADPCTHQRQYAA
ncbi:MULTISPECIES: luciferase family protein [Streptomyces]|uniref:luciferase domain-containing protein n=2 Tax=Streptomyces TaxID=1883 RepID=UPI001105B819|nr:MULTISPECIES: luciferase family protein [Streptomyces]MCZ4100005.1 DUF5519 family protein [Streptomyces sp. H39-C1]